MAASPCSSNAPVPIAAPKILMTEGADACFFCRWALQAYGLTGFQVIDFGGNTELSSRLQSLTRTTGFDRHAQAVVVARDAETSADSAVQSIRHAFEKAELAVPERPYAVSRGEPKTGFILFPGLDDTGALIQSGCLEDLCLATIGESPLLDCVDSFVRCCEAAGGDHRRIHKVRLHSYLAGNGRFAGMKIGEAARANAWNWSHPRMRPLETFLRNL